VQAANELDRIRGEDAFGARYRGPADLDVGDLCHRADDRPSRHAMLRFRIVKYATHAPIVLTRRRR
jgi:hypothetical protein